MNTNGSVGGGYNMAADFAVYDKLPARVREALQDGPFNGSAQSAIALKRSLHLDFDELADELLERYRQIQAVECKKTYGYEHPQATQECPWPLNPRMRKRRMPLDTRMVRL